MIDADLETIWRKGDATLIGPVMPPMIAWFLKGCPKSAWEKAAELRIAKQDVVYSAIARDLFEWAEVVA